MDHSWFLGRFSSGLPPIECWDCFSRSWWRDLDWRWRHATERIPKGHPRIFHQRLCIQTPKWNCPCALYRRPRCSWAWSFRWIHLEKIIWIIKLYYMESHKIITQFNPIISVWAESEWKNSAWGWKDEISLESIC